jgi:glycosyltransferase involved in cell wall biosynthesis
MKNIAILTERLKTGFGVDLVVHQQAKRLSRKYNVSVFAIEIEDSFIKDAKYPIYKQLWIPLHFNPIKQDYVSYKSLNKHKHLIAGYDTYIIHTPTFNSWIPYLKSQGKVIVYSYGNSPSNGYNGLKKYRKNIFDILEQNIYFKMADQIITISSYLQHELPLSLQNKTEVHPLGGDHILDVYNTLSSTEIKDVYKKYFIEPKDTLITYIGRLDYKNNPYKNTYDLIRLQKTIESTKNNRVKIFAMGFPENNIEREMYKQGICVIPRVNVKDMSAVLHRAHVHVSPSQWEGFDLPLLEAQTLGIPVVAYNTAAHPEIVINGETGFLANSFVQFSNNVRELIKDHKKRNIMAKKAELFAQKFTWKNNVELLENHL